MNEAAAGVGLLAVLKRQAIPIARASHSIDLFMAPIASFLLEPIRNARAASSSEAFGASAREMAAGGTAGAH